MQGEIRDRFFRPELLKRILIFGILILVLGCAQCSFFPVLKICPRTPDLIMGLLLAVTLIDSNKSAAVCALCAGFFIDAVGGAGVPVSPIIYLLFVVFITLFSQKMLTSFASFAILLLPLLVYRATATVICMAISDGGFAPVSVIAGVVIPEAICTAVCCLPLYAIVKLCSAPLETHGKFTF